MTYGEWLAGAISGESKKHPAIRRGQYWSGALLDANVPLAMEINGMDKIDPYYEDENLGRFFEYLEAHWEE